MDEFEEDAHLPALAGQRLQRGVMRALRQLGFTGMEEMPLPGRLRADVMALGPRGEIWIVECKSSRADFRADQKWQGYLPYCDAFFWAVGLDFPRELLPADHGLILADAWGGEVIRHHEGASPLAAARRRRLTLAFARHASARLQSLRDPRP